MNKFYVPKIEEFHIGFRYQWYDGLEDKWEDETFPNDFVCTTNNGEPDLVELFYSKLKETRVKCLDQNDIEELGWEYSPDDSSLSGGYWLDYYYLHVGLDIYMLRYCNERKTVRINYKHSVYDSDTLFFGEIKNYNKLKDVMEMLKII